MLSPAPGSERATEGGEGAEYKMLNPEAADLPPPKSPRLGCARVAQVRPNVRLLASRGSLTHGLRTLRRGAGVPGRRTTVRGQGPDRTSGGSMRRAGSPTR